MFVDVKEWNAVPRATARTDPENVALSDKEQARDKEHVTLMLRPCGTPRTGSPVATGRKAGAVRGQHRAHTAHAYGIPLGVMKCFEMDWGQSPNWVNVIKTTEVSASQGRTGAT